MLPIDEYIYFWNNTVEEDMATRPIFENLVCDNPSGSTRIFWWTQQEVRIGIEDWVEYIVKINISDGYQQKGGPWIHVCKTTTHH